jgi:hypothetical protein
MSAAKSNPLNAKNESRSIDFKSSFDPDSPGEWCELIKDIVAIANSGGGSILIGVDDQGKCCGPAASAKLLKLDPAVITDKIAKYTGAQFDSFVVNAATRRGGKIAAITIGCADPPMIFEKPGTYPVQDGKQQQKTAFGAGTLYVRHGAKSEPARYTDVVRLVERSVQRARKEWLSGVKKVTSAPSGSTISVLSPQVIQSSDPSATPIRITDDPTAPGYQLVDPDKTHPWRQKELLQELNKSLPSKISSFDLLAARRVHGTDDDPNFVYKPHFGSKQYSPAFAKWLLERHSTDPKFFEKCRSTLKLSPTLHVAVDPRFQWLSEFMLKNHLSLAQMAQRLKIDAATVSRLLAGKYQGNVERMLERIKAYERETEKQSRQA